MRGYSQPLAIYQDGKDNLIAGCFGDVVGGDAVAIANARLIAAAPELADVCDYVIENTYCGADGEWHFKSDYDPQRALDALRKATTV